MGVPQHLKTADWRDPRAWLADVRLRGYVWQLLLLIALGFFAYEIVSNTAANLQKQRVASGFEFLGRTAGFDISQTLIPYSSLDSYGRAFWVGLLNTLLVAVAGIVLATVLGFAIGFARLSQNWLIARLATVYVEIIRNVPLLLLLFMIYFGVLRTLPGVADTIALPFGAMFNVRGLYLPRPVFGPGMGLVALSAVAAILAALVWARVVRRRQLVTGERRPVLLPSLAGIVLMPLLVFVLLGAPVSFTYPTPGRFNLEGGIAIQPELMGLLLGLTIYTASFIAEVVRAGIAGIAKGQTEAGRALGLSRGQVLRLVVVPQAMRLIIPPLTNQYLNLVKNSSLAVAVGYPDLVSVFAGTVLNQTNQAVEVILITMLVYLALSLITSLAMNWFNARMAIVER
jgi:general L-amino acid transport system permease protein